MKDNNFNQNNRISSQRNSVQGVNRNVNQDEDEIFGMSSPQRANPVVLSNQEEQQIPPNSKAQFGARSMMNLDNLNMPNANSFVGGNREDLQRIGSVLLPAAKSNNLFDNNEVHKKMKFIEHMEEYYSAGKREGKQFKHFSENK